MELLHPSTRPLLSGFASSTSNDDDDDEYYHSRTEHQSSALRSNNNDVYDSSGGGGGSGGHGQRRQNQLRRSKRYARSVIILGALVIVLLVIYVPLFGNIQTRLGMMDVRMANNNNSCSSYCMNTNTRRPVVPIAGWEFNKSRHVADYVFPYRDTTLMEPRTVCHSKFFLLIVVCSAVENFSARQTIRETWGNVTEFNYPLFSKIHSNFAGQYLDIKESNLGRYAEFLRVTQVSNSNESSHQRNYPVRIVFLIGKSYYSTNETLGRLKLESEQYDDLLQEDFHDTYNNLTIKSVMMLKWIRKRCLNHAKFLMKCDDDTFINVPNLLHYLFGGTVPVYNSTIEYYDALNVNALVSKNRLNQDQDLLIGMLICYAKPVAKINDKYYSPFYMYGADVYPNYLSGSGYLMSIDVVPKLLNASLETLLFHFEDVYITGICAEKVKLHRRNNPLFQMSHYGDKCGFKGTITQHYVKGDLMRDAYAFVSNTTIDCPPPDKFFKVKRLRKRFKNCE